MAPNAFALVLSSNGLALHLPTARQVHIWAKGPAAPASLVNLRPWKPQRDL